ncbi:hypothetical protein N665_0028s0009 [Sinapis alba]|nr:hypothetical protein N665_0028s0009 [Sinapis alba]
MSIGRRVTRSSLRSTHNPEKEACDSSDEVNPKVEFVAHSLDPTEAAAYWETTCNLEPPPPEMWSPERPRTKWKVLEGLSKSIYSFLMTIRSFCQVPNDVVFQISQYGETAKTPPPGYFTCYEAHFLRRQLWFPTPAIIVRTLNRFNVLISQISPRGLQHLILILLLSVERGMTLDVNYLEGLLGLADTSKKRSYCFKLRPYMTITKSFTSNEKTWKSAYLCLGRS